MAKIYLSFPCYGNPQMSSITSLLQAMQTTKHKVQLKVIEGESLILRARNQALADFWLNSDDDYFCTIDSDIEVCNQYVSLNMFDQLVAHNLDYVGGLYALKTVYEDRKPRSASYSVEGKNTFTFNSGLVEMRWLSGGCQMLSRKCVGDLIKAHSELEYWDERIGKCWALYLPKLILNPDDPKDVHVKMPSEDWMPCYYWRALGGKVWADTSIVLKHSGFPMFPVSLEVKKKTEVVRLQPPLVIPPDMLDDLLNIKPTGDN